MTVTSKVANTSYDSRRRPSHDVVRRKYKREYKGDGMVGKTCLIKSFLGESFSDKYEATSFEVYSGYSIKDGERYHMEIYDFAGERDKGILFSHGLQRSQVVVVCFNVNDPESFDGVDSFWLPLLQNLRTKPKIIVAGLQNDKKSKVKKRATNVRYTPNHKMHGIELVQCSALHGEKVCSVFSKIIDLSVKLNKKKYGFLKGAFKR